MRKVLLFLVMLTMYVQAKAQTTYLQLNTEDYNLLDRLETRSGRLSDSLFLATKPESRSRAVDFLLYDRAHAASTLSAIDTYNINNMLSENGEWVPGGNGAANSKKAWFNAFYKKQDDFIYVKTDNFFLVVNPVLSAEAIHEDGNTKKVLFSNSHGAEIRGRITNRIGFYTALTDNQETPPQFVNNWIASRQAVPGADYYISSKTNSSPYDYFQASGYFDIALVKDHMNLTFGTGKNFIGDGIRSLFLSDFSSNTPFLRLITRIWKLDYQNLYLELTPQYNRGMGDVQLPHKYATINHLGYNATRWLNVGIFESVVFAKPNTFQISYLNPIIFTKPVEQYNGNPDKAIVGFDFKALAARHLQFYGQFLLNEFTSKEFFSNDGYWGNKWGLQLGGKYFDAFTVKNLDLQAEVNIVRPYTYSAKDTIANYTNYNQPLADPLGSGFVELLGIAKYQPAKNVYLTLKGMYYIKGNDTGSLNYGNDIFNNFSTRPGDYGIGVINGPRSKCASINLNISYQLRRNLFVDLGGTHRKYVASNGGVAESSTIGAVAGSSTTTYFYFGIRLNAARRDYDFF